MIERKQLFISLVIAALLSSIIFILSNDFGITWDEPIYMRNGDRYVTWVLHPDWKTKDSTFQATTGDIHPPLRKLLGGITHDIVTTRLHVIDNTRGYRISSLLFVLPLILVFSYIAIGQFGYTIGILLPFVLSLMPHVLFLTPLFTLDYAIAALWFLAVVFAMKGMKSYLWLTLSAICVGAAMLTKLHGFLLIIPVCGYYVWKRAYKRCVSFLIIASVIFIIGWPWLWTNTLGNIYEFLRLQISHGMVPEYIFGHAYAAAPWWYTPVMFFVTTPAFVLLFLCIGSLYTIRKGSVWDRVILVNALFPIVFFSLPGVYRYDWIRLQN